MTLKELLEFCCVKNEFEDINVSGICYDSRKVKTGDVFVCITGFLTDGHEYAKAAAAAGAAAVVSERPLELPVPVVLVENSREALALMSDKFYGSPSRKFKLIGVTGTNGKTTVTYLVKYILEKAGFKVGLIGTNKNMIGDMDIPTERTTPESLELAALFAKMAEQSADYVVMEVSSHSLELSRVAACDFDVGAFTNLTQDHLDFHGSMENYLTAKAKLFDMCKTGVINVDDAGGRKIAVSSGCVTVSYGMDGATDIFADNVQLGSDGVEFGCDILGKKCKMRINTPGRFSVYNALCAIGICTVCGISDGIIKDGLREVRGVSGRAELVPVDKDYTVMIDYAHTPDGIENILKGIRSFAKGRVVILFGCGGDRDRGKRPKMGEIAGRLADFCIITSDNPRSENPCDIISEIVPGVEKSGGEYVVIENRRDAIRYALENGRKDDVILLAGKGHETYQILSDGKIHFDEREVIREILEDGPGGKC